MGFGFGPPFTEMYSKSSGKPYPSVIDARVPHPSAETIAYLVALSDQTGTITAGDTVTVSAQAAINPSNNSVATKNEFDLYINGQYIDKQVYTWTPTDTGTQTITFNTATLGYNLQSTDLIIINGRWA